MLVFLQPRLNFELPKRKPREMVKLCSHAKIGQLNVILSPSLVKYHLSYSLCDLSVIYLVLYNFQIIFFNL